MLPKTIKSIVGFPGTTQLADFADVSSSVRDPIFVSTL